MVSGQFNLEGKPKVTVKKGMSLEHVSRYVLHTMCSFHLCISFVEMTFGVSISWSKEKSLNFVLENLQLFLKNFIVYRTKDGVVGCEFSFLFDGDS